MFDIDATKARRAMRRTLFRFVDPGTGKVLCRDSSPAAAFAAVGEHIRIAMEQYSRKHPELKAERQ